MSVDPDKLDKFLDLLKIGHTRRDAAKLSDIQWQTVKGWVRGSHDGDDYCKKMVGHMESSEAGIVDSALRAVSSAAAAGQWKAATWLLEAKRPKDFGPKDATPVNPSLPGRVIDVTPSLPDGAAKERLFLLAMKLCDEDPLYGERLRSHVKLLAESNG